MKLDRKYGWMVNKNMWSNRALNKVGIRIQEMKCMPEVPADQPFNHHQKKKKERDRERIPKHPIHTNQIILE